MRKISVFLFILILQNSLEASCLEYLAERDCTRYEPLFGIWEFTYDSGLVGLPQTDTFTLDTLDRFNDYNCCYDNYYCGYCICGHDQHGAFTYVASVLSQRCFKENTKTKTISISCKEK